MRKMFWCSMLSVSLLGGAACKKSETERTGREVRKTQEEVKHDQRSASEAESKLTEAKQRLSEARTSFTTESNERLSRIDAKIETLSQRTDPGSREMAASLRGERDQLADRLQRLSKEDLSTWSNERWKSAKKEIEDELKNLEKNVDEATK